MADAIGQFIFIYFQSAFFELESALTSQRRFVARTTVRINFDARVERRYGRRRRCRRSQRRKPPALLHSQWKQQALDFSAIYFDFEAAASILGKGNRWRFRDFGKQFLIYSFEFGPEFAARSFHRRPRLKTIMCWSQLFNFWMDIWGESPCLFILPLAEPLSPPIFATCDDHYTIRVENNQKNLKLYSSRYKYKELMACQITLAFNKNKKIVL